MADKVHNVDRWLTINDLVETAVTGAVGLFGKPQPVVTNNNYYGSSNSANTGVPNTLQEREMNLGKDEEDEDKKSPLIWILGGVALIVALWLILKK